MSDKSKHNNNNVSKSPNQFEDKKEYDRKEDVMEDENEGPSSQKTVTSFVIGLLVGCLLSWTFSDNQSSPVEVVDNEDEQTTETETEVVVDGTGDDKLSDEQTAAVRKAIQAELEKTNSDNTEDDAKDNTTETVTKKDGMVKVSDQPAGSSVKLEGANFPTDEGWVAIRTYENDIFTNILGARRYSKSDNITPES